MTFSDASDVAFGGFSASLDGLAATGMFTFDDLGQSSTFHELKAIYDVLLSFAGQLTHQRVKVFTDNQRVSRIVSIGSSKARLYLVTLSLFQFCSARDISLELQWIPRSLNEKADQLSRFCDKDESICFPASGCQVGSTHNRPFSSL